MKPDAAPTHPVAIQTALGAFTAHFSPMGLAGLDFPGAKAATTPSAAVNPRWVEDTAAAVNETLEGRRHRPLPPLDLQAGTEFQREVWNALRGIPPGATASYLEIARKLGRPKAARAVGQACGANPIPVLIPCHRVLASNGKLGGFSGGLDWKRRLLAIEQAPHA